MSYWEWEAPARPLPCRTTHLCPSSTFSEEQCVIDLSSPPLPQGSFSPGLLLLRAIEDREHLTLENILYCREFKKKEAELIFFPFSVSKDLIYKTALETTSHWVYFLCQLGLSVKCCCLWLAQWSISALELKPKSYVQKGPGSWDAGFYAKKDDFPIIFQNAAGDKGRLCFEFHIHNII